MKEATGISLRTPDASTSRTPVFALQGNVPPSVVVSPHQRPFAFVALCNVTKTTTQDKHTDRPVARQQATPLGPACYIIIGLRRSDTKLRMCDAKTELQIMRALTHATIYLQLAATA